jgi:guanosine-3',5'-bis(diphosphate) 3'-pyrophosphohydrolase
MSKEDAVSDIQFYDSNVMLEKTEDIDPHIGEKMDSIGTLLEALRFAADRHRGQQRKDGGTAYINHPIAVAHKLNHVGGIVDPVVLCSAILHDTLEDTATTKEELARCFGEEIAKVVWEVTDDLTLKADKNRKAERKQMEIDHAPKLSHKAKLVKMADKICNAEDTFKSPPANWSIEEKSGYINWAKQVIDGMRGTNKALEAEFDELFARSI